VWKRKGDVSDIWKCELVANMPADVAFEVLSSSCLGNMLYESFQVLEDVENIRVCTYISHYPDVPQPVHWLTVQTGRKWKDNYIIIETSLKWHPAFTINQNYHSQANLVFRATILEPKKQDTNITFFEYSEASYLPNFRLSFAQSISALLNIVNPAIYATLPVPKKFYVDAPEHTKKKTSLMFSALSKTDKRKTSKLHSPSSTLVTLEEALSRPSAPSSPATKTDEDKERRSRRDRELRRTHPPKSPTPTPTSLTVSPPPEANSTATATTTLAIPIPDAERGGGRGDGGESPPGSKSRTPPREKTKGGSSTPAATLSGAATNSSFSAVSEESGDSLDENSDDMGVLNESPKGEVMSPKIERGGDGTRRDSAASKHLAIPSKEKPHKKRRTTGGISKQKTAYDIKSKKSSARKESKDKR